MIRRRAPLLRVLMQALLLAFASSFLDVVATSMTEGSCRNSDLEDHDGSSCSNAKGEVEFQGVNDSYDNNAAKKEETITLELNQNLLHRIHEALQDNGNGVVDKERIQQIAVEAVQKIQAEEEETRLQRELLMRQHMQQQQAQGEPIIDFPYDLTPPPPPSTNGDYSLDFCKDWTPPGGSRYAEYASGRSPYHITDELKNQSDDIARLRRPYVQQAMKHAWDGYTKYAFGDDEVRPQSRKGTNHWGGISVTLVDSLDTLWLMNMTDEFQQARNYVKDELSHDQNRKVSVFETTIRSLGGLLSAYDWSRDEVFLEEAMDLARRLMRAFEHPITGETILPFGEVNLQDGSCNMIPWAGGNAILSEFGTLQIEFRYLDEIMQTSETRSFRDKVETIFEMLHEMAPENGLYPYYMKTNHEKSGSGRDIAAKHSTLPRKSTRAARVSNTDDDDKQPLAKPVFSNDHLTFGAMADSFYEYMLKIWLQGGKTEPMYRDMYDKAMQGMHDELLHISTPSGLMYLADKVGGGNTGKRQRTHHKMDHLCCFVGGMLALGAYTDPLGIDSKRAQRDLETAKALTYTCYQFYARMKTGISPEFVEFVAGDDFKVGKIAPHYLLRPEAVESFYILSVLTGDPIYREWGWEVFQSIEKYCKTHVAYGSLRNVELENTDPRDDMESFFLSETLKYLYLLFHPEAPIDLLNKHVFNTEAHPLRVFPVIEEDLTVPKP